MKKLRHFSELVSVLRIVGGDAFCDGFELRDEPSTGLSIYIAEHFVTSAGSLDELAVKLLEPGLRTRRAELQNRYRSRLREAANFLLVVAAFHADTVPTGAAAKKGHGGPSC